MIVMGAHPSPTRADDLWESYRNISGRPYDALSGLMADYIIKTNPGMFALFLAEAGAAQ